MKALNCQEPLKRSSSTTKVQESCKQEKKEQLRMAYADVRVSFMRHTRGPR